jgi:HK97 family phage prohead protease
VHERAEFELGVKAVEVSEADDGTLYIEGLASDFQTDRDLEAFEPDAFTRGLKAYLDNPILLYHHSPDKQLGQVTDAFLDKAGLHIKAMIPKPPAGSWAELIYDQVKRGIMRGFSVGGAFRRRMTSMGPRIYDVDLQEISVTPLPVNPRTMFAVAGKAFGDNDDAEQFQRLWSGLEGVDAAFTSALERVSQR